jgi:hypothetical protein
MKEEYKEYNANALLLSLWRAVPKGPAAAVKRDELAKLAGGRIIGWPSPAPHFWRQFGGGNCPLLHFWSFFPLVLKQELPLAKTHSWLWANNDLLLLLLLLVLLLLGPFGAKLECREIVLLLSGGGLCRMGCEDVKGDWRPVPIVRLHFHQAPVGHQPASHRVETDRECGGRRGWGRRFARLGIPFLTVQSPTSWRVMDCSHLVGHNGMMMLMMMGMMVRKGIDVMRSQNNASG